MYDIILYEKESGRSPVKEYLSSLMRDNKIDEAAQIRAFVDRLKAYGMGVNNHYPETIRKVSPEGVWELRPGGNRVFFFHFDGEKIVLLHAYPKQSQKAPKNEIEQAVREMKDYNRRRKNEGKHF